MNPELKLARDYYDRLPKEAKEKVMPKHLLKAIEIAERSRESGLSDAADIAAKHAGDDKSAANSATDLDDRLKILAQAERALAIETDIRIALARVTKPDGK